MTGRHVPVHLANDVPQGGIELVDAVLVHPGPFATDGAEKGADVERGEVGSAAVGEEGIVDDFGGGVRVGVAVQLGAKGGVDLLVQIYAIVSVQGVGHLLHGDIRPILVVIVLLPVSSIRTGIVSVFVHQHPALLHVLVHLSGELVLLLGPRQAPHELGQSLREFVLDRGLVGHVQCIPHALPQFHQIQFANPPAVSSPSSSLLPVHVGRIAPRPQIFPQFQHRQMTAPLIGPTEHTSESHLGRMKIEVRIQ
mmetsp:Transcript_30067/g.89343  ORF Transcript_30067/g.89343 Transcript_30067/m.89343 type:complete len:252 (+) Transcript_30067:964-1719(+)